MRNRHSRKKKKKRKKEKRGGVKKFFSMREKSILISYNNIKNICQEICKGVAEKLT